MSAPFHDRSLSGAAQMQKVRDLLGTALPQREIMNSKTADDASRDDATKRYFAAVDAMVLALAELRRTGDLAALQNFLLRRDGA